MPSKPKFSALLVVSLLLNALCLVLAGAVLLRDTSVVETDEFRVTDTNGVVAARWFATEAGSELAFYRDGHVRSRMVADDGGVRIETLDAEGGLVSLIRVDGDGQMIEVQGRQIAEEHRSHTRIVVKEGVASLALDGGVGTLQISAGAGNVNIRATSGPAADAATLALALSTEKLTLNGSLAGSEFSYLDMGSERAKLSLGTGSRTIALRVDEVETGLTITDGASKMRLGFGPDLVGLQLQSPEGQTIRWPPAPVVQP